MLYKKFGRLVGDTLLPEGSLKYYLTHSREYLGEKASVKYTVYHKGLVQYQKEGNTTKEAKTVQRSYCFNLKLLAERYNINLEQENSHNRQDRGIQFQVINLLFFSHIPTVVNLWLSSVVR